MMNTSEQFQVFTFDKATEQKTGVLTIPIFSVCLFFSSLIIMAIAGLGLSLGGYFLSEMTSISIADGAISDQLEIISTCSQIILFTGFALSLIYGLSAARHLLVAYALFEDGYLIKMKWKFRRVHSMQAHIVAGEIAKATSTNRTSAYQTLRGILAFFDGIAMMHNPMVIMNHLNGSKVCANIITIPLENISVLKKTKKKLVIMADTLVKDKPKRKKFQIFWMYNDMDALCQGCERGRFVVNQ